MSTKEQKTAVLYQLTHAEKRIWYIENIYPETSLHNIGGYTRIKGKIDFKILEESIQQVIARNDGLRLRFTQADGEVKQYISEYKREGIDFFDFTVFDDPDVKLQEWIKREGEKPFVIENNSLFYFAIYKIREDECGYLVKLHHIISDGWSFHIISEQVSKFYTQLMHHEAVDHIVGNSYLEYIEIENKYLSSEKFLKSKNFWKKKFGDLSDLVLMESSDDIRGERKLFDLNQEQTSKVKEFLAEKKYSMNTFFLEVYFVYLSKATQRKDLVVGCPVFNRNGRKEKSIVGMFTSTMPLRYFVEDQLTVMETLAKMNRELKECYFNQRYPYDLILQDIELKKQGYDNLYNTCINYYNMQFDQEFDGNPYEVEEFYNGNQAYSLQIVIREWQSTDRLAFCFDYKKKDYSTQDIEEMYQKLMYLMMQMVECPEKKICDLSLLTEEEQKKYLVDYNNTAADYPKEKTIYQLIEEQVEQTPDHIALRFEGKELTYRELNERSNQLARYLRNKGVTRNVIVGLLTDHSIETVVGILATLKAGGAYIPIDPKYPRDRIRYMLEDSESKLLLTNVNGINQMPMDIEVIDLNQESLYSGESSNLVCMNRVEDLVYIIYTSGSTGKPKGTMIEHKGLTNYICWAKKMYVRNDHEIFPLYSSLAFDLTVTSIYTPLISGGKIVVYRDDEERYVLYKIMDENQATIMKLTPAHLSLIKELDNTNSSIQSFIVGGEMLKVSLAKEITESFGGKIDIYNEYGPTEAVVGCMIHRYDEHYDQESSVPIGVPADNQMIYILDSNLQPVPKNTVGEMYISGDGIARGYIKRPDMNADKFFENPFVPGKRMYRTGDLARFLERDIIEYVGRIDKQVKIRGYRIELGEIERTILMNPEIRDVVVIDRENDNSVKYLCAYYVKKTKISVKKIKDMLLERLPEYMVPLYFVELQEIPLTSNGKVNLSALKEPTLERNEQNDIYESEQEKKLAEAMCEVLKLQYIGRSENFFLLGGDSIKAIQISAKLKNKGYKLKVKDILAHPIFEEMVLYLEIENQVAEDEIKTGYIEPTPIQMWFFEQKFTNPNYYLQSIVVRINGNYRKDKLEKAVQQLIRIHDSFRLSYDTEAKQLYYNNALLDQAYQIKEYDCSQYDCQTEECQEKIKQIENTLKQSIRLEQGSLFQVVVINLGKQGRKMLMVAHHLIVDGVSWRIILEDINQIYQKEIGASQEIVQYESSSYQTWAKELHSDFTVKNAMSEQDYWNQVMDAASKIPYDYDLGEDSIRSTQTVTAYLSKENTTYLRTQIHSTYHTEILDYLVLGLGLAVRKQFGQQQVMIELEGHGRDEIQENIDVSRTVGWFTSIYPVSIEIQGEEISTQIKSVKEQLRKVPNKGMYYGILYYLMNQIHEKKQKTIRLNYLGDLDEGVADQNSFTIEEINRGNDIDLENCMTSQIDINLYVLHEKLTVDFTYSKNKFKEQTISALQHEMIHQLEKLISHCMNEKETYFTPSDFTDGDLSQGELDMLFEQGE